MLGISKWLLVHIVLVMYIGIVNGGMVNCGLVEGGIMDGGMVNCNLVEGGVVDGVMAGDMVDGGMLVWWMMVW